jgi:hypothetical protein
MVGPHVFTRAIALVFGFLLTIGLGIPIYFLMTWTSSEIKIPRPRRIAEEDWKDITKIPGRWGGTLIGMFERVLFFGALLSPSGGFVVGGWLAFKVASKWEVWTNTYKIPDKFPGATITESLVARTRWGSRTYQRFLLGTGANLISALLGVGTYKLLSEAPQWFWWYMLH